MLLFKKILCVYVFGWLIADFDETFGNGFRRLQCRFIAKLQYIRGVGLESKDYKNVQL